MLFVRFGTNPTFEHGKLALQAGQKGNKWVSNSGTRNPPQLKSNAYSGCCLSTVIYRVIGGCQVFLFAVFLEICDSH